MIIPDFELPEAEVAPSGTQRPAAQEIAEEELDSYEPPQRFARVQASRLNPAAIITGLATYGCLQALLSLAGYFLFPDGWSLYLLCGLAGIGAGFMTMENARGRGFLACSIVALLALIGELIWAARIVLALASWPFDWGVYRELLFATEYRAVFLALVCVPAGGLMRRLTGRLSWRRRPLRPWHYQTIEGRRIVVYGPGRDLLRSAFWLVAALAFVAMGVLSVFLEVRWNRLNPHVNAKVNVGRTAGAFAILGLVCVRSYQRRRTPSALELLARDARRPIVLLRSFGDDGADGYGGILDKMFHGVYALLARTWEQRLAKRLSRTGPFIAIGRPGEELPELGAARMYVSDSDWQVVVKDLMRRAHGVVFQAGESAGLRWELRVVSRLLQPDQVIVFLPFSFDRNVERREERYSTFRSWAKSAFPGQLSEFIEEEFFLYWSIRPRWKGYYLERGDDVDDIPDTHRFKETLQRLARDRYFRPRRLFGPFFYWSLALIALALGVFMLIGLFGILFR